MPRVKRIGARRRDQVNLSSQNLRRRPVTELQEVQEPNAAGLPEVEAEENLQHLPPIPSVSSDLLDSFQR